MAASHHSIGNGLTVQRQASAFLLPGDGSLAARQVSFACLPPPRLSCPSRLPPVPPLTGFPPHPSPWDSRALLAYGAADRSPARLQGVMMDVMYGNLLVGFVFVGFLVWWRPAGC